MSELIGTPKVTDINANISNWIVCVYRRTDDLHVGQDRIMICRAQAPNTARKRSALALPVAAHGRCRFRLAIPGS